MATIIVWTERKLRRAVELEAARRKLGVSETAEQILWAGLKQTAVDETAAARMNTSAGGARRVRDQQPA
jgi:hypothetical protein